MKQPVNNPSRITMVGCVLISSITAHASTPLWTYSVPNPSIINVSPGGSATATYTVTNQSKKSKSLLILTNPPKPNTPTPGLSASACILPTKGSTCTLTITIDGSQIPDAGLRAGPYMCETNGNGSPNVNQCYQPSAGSLLNITKNTSQPTSLSLSVSQLVLSANGFPTPASSGIPRVITVTNTGSANVETLQVLPPIWPIGTTNSTTCGSTLAVGSTCTITVRPGTIPSSDGTNSCSRGTSPIAGTLQVSANNAVTVSANILILGYGCLYQGGYIYALDDTTPNTSSIGGGKVAAITEQAPPFPLPGGISWSANGEGDVSYDVISGIDLNSTSSTGSPTYLTFASFFTSNYTNPNPFTSASFSECDGLLDGVCNTINIITFYNEFITHNTNTVPPYTATAGPTPLNSYAAGLCKQIINGNSDWYLPALCEMGYGSSCGTAIAPALQNMQSSLIDFIPFNSFVVFTSGLYWSSTEDATQPESTAWTQDTTLPGQYSGTKEVLAGVRCSRIFTL